MKYELLKLDGLQMAALKDDDDLCRCNQLPLASIDSLTAGISLTDHDKKPFKGENQQECLNISFIEKDKPGKKLK